MSVCKSICIYVETGSSARVCVWEIFSTYVFLSCSHLLRTKTLSVTCNENPDMFTTYYLGICTKWTYLHDLWKRIFMNEHIHIRLWRLQIIQLRKITCTSSCSRANRRLVEIPHFQTRPSLLLCVIFRDRSCPSSFADANAAKNLFIGAALNLSNCMQLLHSCYILLLVLLTCKKVGSLTFETLEAMQVSAFYILL